MGVTITKKELVNRIAEKAGVTKVVTKNIIQSFLDEIIEELGQGNRLEFREFGVFEVKSRAPRRAQNPRTLEKVEVPAKKVVKFKVGRLMKERVKAGSDENDDEDVIERKPAARPAARRSAMHEASLGGDNSDPPAPYQSDSEEGTAFGG